MSEPTQRTSPAMAAADTRPRPLHGSRSFTRMDNSPTPASPRKRASTLQDAGIPAIPEARHIETSPELNGKRPMADVFENHEDEEHAEEEGKEEKPELKIPSTFDELPIEIKSLCERFLESLSAKVHPTPLNADQLSELFQDFYERAASHISTHIATLSARIGRETPPATNNVRKQLGRPRAGSGASKGLSDDLAGNAGGEMLTASEVTDRKRARRLLEHKRLALEEAVERGVCEKVYQKIWKHRSCEDDARDEKLRSRTAALAVVGIGLKELHMDQDPAKQDVRKTAEEKEDEINLSLAAARDALMRMDDYHYPLGKLLQLKEAHKSIVETLSQFFPSSSSADEILPTLIYTLITCPHEGISVVSNLNFIQRFRTSSKVDGEAAYCLVNLEAAISFLETVDLSTLRADELPEGPGKSHSRPSTPTTDKPTLPLRPAAARTITPGLSQLTVNSSDLSTPNNSAKAALPSPSSPYSATRPQLQARRISGLMQAQVDRIEAGRENFLKTADKFYDSVNGTLDNSLQFLLGRFKEQAPADNSPIPKTLEDARKLVSSPIRGEDDDSLSLSGRSSPAVDDPLNGSSKAADSKLLELLGGKGSIRDRSADSTRSGGSGGRRAVTFDGRTSAGRAQLDPQPPTAPANLFASINPLNRFGMPNMPNMPKFPNFGRPANVTTPPVPSPPEKRLLDSMEAPKVARSGDAPERIRSRENGGVDDLNARESLAELKKLKPPRKRFLEVNSANDLKLGEVEELLKDYRRLAKAIGEAIAQ